MGNCIHAGRSNEPFDHNISGCQPHCIPKPPQRVNSLLRPSTKDKLGEEGQGDTNGFLKTQEKDKMVNSHKHVTFSYKALHVATEKFREKNLVGQGGCGDVYKGWINYCSKEAAKPDSGYTVAVKKLKKDGSQRTEEIQTELRIMNRFNHPHIVKLIGSCFEGTHSLLVFEFMPMGSLEDNLSKESTSELNWRRRIEIATGSAKGLEYLHTIHERPIIHCDIKTANILLDKDFTPKIADFGLAKFGPQGDKSHVSTRVLGTTGYFAPEYVGTGHLTLKTDVYSFGVVLLEIPSGCPAAKGYPDGRLKELVQWARPYLNSSEELHHVIDKRLQKNLQMEEAYEFARIILKCINPDPKTRPTMTEVVHSLEQLEQKTNAWNKLSAELKHVINSKRTQSLVSTKHKELL